MEKIVKILKLNEVDYYTKHLEIVNPWLPVKLTPKEIEVLGNFMSLKGDIADDRFGTSGRKIVKQRMGLADGGLGNYIKSLKDKGFLIGEDKLEILPFLQVNEKVQFYMFKIETDEKI